MKSMNPPARVFSCLGVLLAVAFLSGPAYARDETLWSEVKTLRDERERKMPYLDKDIIASEIKPDKIFKKEAFITGTTKTLDDLIERALETDTKARAARERITLAKLRIFAAVRALMPEASVEVQSKKGELSDSHFNSFNYRLKFKQPIFRGGVLWNTLLQEKASLESAKKEYEAVMSDLINDVCAAYFEYNRSERVVSGQAAVIEKMQHFVDISNRKYKEAIVSEIESLNAQSLFNQARYDHETSKQEQELAKLDLQKYLDLGIDDNLSVTSLYNLETLLEQSKEKRKEAAGSDDKAYEITEERTIPDLEELVDLAYQHRPELQVEAAKLESARLEERVRWGKTLPSIDATMEFGKLREAFVTDTLNPSFNPEFRFMIECNWNVGGNKVNYTYENDERGATVSQFQGGSGTVTRRSTFTAGLLDGLSAIAEAKESEVAKLEQVTQLEKAEKEAIHDVKQAYFDYQKARIQVKSSLQRVDYRQRLARVSKHRLDKNEIQISEYLQTELDLLQELTTLHKALAEYFTAKAKMNHSIGLRDYFSIKEIHGSASSSGPSGV